MTMSEYHAALVPITADDEEIAIRLDGVCKYYPLFSGPASAAFHATGLERLLPKALRSSPKMHRALDGINLTIRKGEKVGILGRNGAGKTTMLKLITGNYRPTHGEVTVNGDVKALMSMGLGFHPAFSGLENIRSSLLYNGLPADYDSIGAIAAREGMTVVADAAQSFGARYNGHPVGSLAAYTTTSFFPSKPLGCFGDGGAVLTNDDDKAELLRSLRVHGKGTDKYDNVRIGLNSRLDTLQAAVLLAKLEIFTEEIAARNAVAQAYSQALADIVEVPVVSPGCRSAWAQYTLKARNRAEFIEACRRRGVPTAIYYPAPVNRQKAYQRYPVAGGEAAVAAQLAETVISLPMHPYLDETAVEYIVDTVKSFFGSSSQ